MSIIDGQLQVAADVAITTATTYTSDTIPLAETGSISREQFGEPMELVIQVNETFAGGTSVDFRFTSGNTSGLGSPVTQHSTGAIATATLVAGYKQTFPVNFTTADGDATHIGVLAVSLGTHSTGEYNAWIQRAGEDQVTIND